MKVLDRFLQRAELTQTCWLWNTKRKDGYGQFGIEYKVKLPHRVAYELFIEPIPEGMTIDHLCRVRNCVNPDHLEVVTLKENCRRRHALKNHEPVWVEWKQGGICQTCYRSRVPPKSKPSGKSKVDTN